MKKAISLLLALVMLCMAFPTSVFALNEYIIYEGVDGCQITGVALTQADNPWLLHDIPFSSSYEGRVWTTAKEHPSLIGCDVVLDLEYEGDLLTFNGKTFADGDAVKLKEINELVVYTADKATKAEYTIIIKEETNGLPTVLIDTDGKPIATKTEYVNASISVLGSDVYNATNIYSAVSEIKLRGNSTMGYDKKPYRIKFDKKQDVLGLGKAKSWVLLADYLDPSTLRNTVAYNLADNIYKFTAQTTGFEVFSPRMKFVEVYLNGEFQGLYEMGDHMQANELRVAINELGDEDNGAEYAGEEIGYFIEFEVKSRVLEEGADGYADWSAFSYITDVGATADKDGKYSQTIKESDLEKSDLLNADDVNKTALFFQYKLPEKPTDLQKYYITDYMQTVNDKILAHDETVWDLIDIDSVVNWYLINELFKNADSQMQSSVYFYKDGTLDEDGNKKDNPDTKLYMAPVWDFDLGAGGVTYGDMNDPTEWRTRNDEYCGWFRELFEMESFTTAVEERWTALRNANIIGQMFSDIDTVGASIKDAAEANFALWHDNYLSEIEGTWMTVPGVSETGDWAAQRTYLSRWLYTRVLWMDGEFGYGSANTENETVSMKDTAVLLDEEAVIASVSGDSTHQYPIKQVLPLDHLAMNVTVTSTTAFDTIFGITVTTNALSNGQTYTINLTPNFSGDWEPNFKKVAVNGTDKTDDAKLEADTYTDARITFNGAIVWHLKNISPYKDNIDKNLSDADILTTYVKSVQLTNITVKQIGATAGDITTISMATYSQEVGSMDAVTEMVDKTIIGGKPIIAGEPKVGNTLTLTDLGITPFGASVRYQWYVDGVAVQGETGKTYKVREEDFGKDVVVKSFGLFDYTGNVESEAVTITGTTPDTPAAPTLSSADTTTITVNAVNGQRYSIDNGETWQDSGVFTGLKAGNVYTVRTYIVETASTPASGVSEALTVTTALYSETVAGDVNANGKLDTSDAVLVLEHSLAFVTIKNDAVLARADISGDTKITTSDARYILYYIVNTAD